MAVPAEARPPGALMVLTGLAWLAGGVLYRGPLAHLLLAWPAGRLAWPLRVVTGFAYADGLIETWNPADALTVAYGLSLAIAGPRPREELQRPRAAWPASRGLRARSPSVACWWSTVSPTWRARRHGDGELVVYELLVAGVVVGLTLDLRLGAGDAWRRDGARGGARVTRGRHVARPARDGVR